MVHNFETNCSQCDPEILEVIAPISLFVIAYFDSSNNNSMVQLQDAEDPSKAEQMQEFLFKQINNDSLKIVVRD